MIDWKWVGFVYPSNWPKAKNIHQMFFSRLVLPRYPYPSLIA